MMVVGCGENSQRSQSFSNDLVGLDVLVLANGDGLTFAKSGSGRLVTAHSAVTILGDVTGVCADRVHVNGLPVELIERGFQVSELVKGESEIEVGVFCAEQLVMLQKILISAPAELKLLELEALLPETLAPGERVVPACLGDVGEGLWVPLISPQVVSVLGGPVQHVNGGTYQVTEHGDVSLSCISGEFVADTMRSTVGGAPVRTEAALLQGTHVQAGVPFEVVCAGYDLHDVRTSGHLLFAVSESPGVRALGESRFVATAAGRIELFCESGTAAQEMQRPSSVEVRPGIEHSLLVDFGDAFSVQPNTIVPFTANWVDGFGNLVRPGAADARLYRHVSLPLPAQLEFMTPVVASPTDGSFLVAGPGLYSATGPGLRERLEAGDVFPPPQFVAEDRAGIETPPDGRQPDDRRNWDRDSDSTGASRNESDFFSSCALGRRPLQWQSFGGADGFQQDAAAQLLGGFNIRMPKLLNPGGDLDAVEVRLPSGEWVDVSQNYSGPQDMPPWRTCPPEAVDDEGNPLTGRCMRDYLILPQLGPDGIQVDDGAGNPVFENDGWEAYDEARVSVVRSFVPDRFIANAEAGAGPRTLEEGWYVLRYSFTDDVDRIQSTHFCTV
ncbi:MAG: hypothetical protein ACI82G_001910, partial [Bradymonadia bacterium]